ncbi:MAG: acyltransferase family protein [Bacteroidaceae bacterium]|nr:acyltransferase family protein [Bacteroidaceae bacterium]
MLLEDKIIPSSSNERDDYADFLKYLLIWLVVLGHFINYYQHTKGFGGLYTWIYTFHMPLFVFISGYFSKHISNYRRKSIDTLLWPFMVFQLMNILYTAIIPLEPLKENFFYPYHQNWYLIALFWWRSFIPYRQFFKKSLVIALAFLISLSVGFFPEWSGFMGLYKTAYFLPFFVMGAYCEDLSKFIASLVRYRAIFIGVFVVYIIGVLSLSFNADVLYKMNYAFKANLGYGDDLQNLLLRFFALIASILMCASVLMVTRMLYNLLENRKKNISGGGTMLCFLGHEFIMIPLIRLYAHFGTIGFGLCIITSVVVTYVLTRKRLVDFFSPLLDMSKFCKITGVKIYKE